MNWFSTTAGCFGSAGLFAEALDGVWFKLAVVIIAAIASWFHNRNKKPADRSEPWGGEDDENYQPHRQTGSAPAPNPNQPLNWEEELKRLLEGKPPLDGTAGTPPPPPPVIHRQTPPPPPLPVSVARESQPTPEESFPSRESSSPWSDHSYDSLPAPTKPLATMEESTHAYHRASQLHETVAAHLQRVDEQTEKHGKALHAPPPARRATSADARAVVALLRRPSTARQALLASFVLAPPKGMES